MIAAPLRPPGNLAAAPMMRGKLSTEQQIQGMLVASPVAQGKIAAAPRPQRAFGDDRCGAATTGEARRGADNTGKALRGATIAVSRSGSLGGIGWKRSALGVSAPYFSCRSSRPGTPGRAAPSSGAREVRAADGRVSKGARAGLDWRRACPGSTGEDRCPHRGRPLYAGDAVSRSGSLGGCWTGDFCLGAVGAVLVLSKGVRAEGDRRRARLPGRAARSRRAKAAPVRRTT